jgi:hypothetical protein
MGVRQRPKLVATLASSPTPAQTPLTRARPGVPPPRPWQCPLTHPIKGNFTTYSGERCIYHVPGGQFYSRAKPERCYATEAEAVKDGAGGRSGREGTQMPRVVPSDVVAAIDRMFPQLAANPRGMAGSGRAKGSR